MRVRMAFGSSGREIELPDQNVACVLRMPEAPVLPDPERAVAEALARPIGGAPLEEMARGRSNAVIVVCDITRPVPNRVIVPPIINTLERAGMEGSQITLLVATGLHRPCGRDELIEMLGERIVENYRVVNHQATIADEQVIIGRTRSGMEVEIDRVYVEASLKITTGFIEPHLMAGYSGGRKLVGIGCGGEQTIKALHAPRIIEHPLSIEGCLEGNVLHEELTEIAGLAGLDFTVNVTMDEDRRVTGVFGGHYDQSFRAGCDFAAEMVGRTVEREVDIVVTSCGGYPLDISYYQTAKAFTGSMHICKPGGTIIALSECRRGLGKPEYVKLCKEVASVDDFLKRFVHAGPEAEWCARRIDQWQIHNLTRALRKCECCLVDDGLTPEQRRLLLHPATNSFEDALSAALERHGSDATIAVIPKGPRILARVA